MRNSESFPPRCSGSDLQWKDILVMRLLPFLLLGKCCCGSRVTPQWIPCLSVKLKSLLLQVQNMTMWSLLLIFGQFVSKAEKDFPMYIVVQPCSFKHLNPHIFWRSSRLFKALKRTGRISACRVDLVSDFGSSSLLVARAN
jgi:hypothetical protein